MLTVCLESLPWWCIHLTPDIRGKKLVKLCGFEASLIYRVSSRTARAVAQRDPVSNKQAKQTNKECV